MLRPVLATSLLSMALPSFAADVTIDFTGLLHTACFGKSNLAPAADGSCGGTGSGVCWLEDGFVVGSVFDPSNSGAHLHRSGTLADRSISYHADAAGLYLRRQDSAAFAFKSLNFVAPITQDIPGTGANDLWEIYGFSSALNPNLGNNPTTPHHHPGRIPDRG